MTHDQKCKNKKCKENGWEKLKVVDVEYIGLTQDEVKLLEKSIDEPRYLVDGFGELIKEETIETNVTDSNGVNPNNDNSHKLTQFLRRSRLSKRASDIHS